MRCNHLGGSLARPHAAGITQIGPETALLAQFWLGTSVPSAACPPRNGPKWAQLCCGPERVPKGPRPTHSPAQMPPLGPCKSQSQQVRIRHLKSSHPADVSTHYVLRDPKWLSRGPNLHLMRPQQPLKGIRWLVWGRGGCGQAAVWFVWLYVGFYASDIVCT